VTQALEAVLPFWLDRPDDEAIEIALQAQAAGLDTLWVGELATFDAIALATAVGHRAPRLKLKIGPLAAGVRSPVSIALAVSSVATLTGSHVDVALGASSPAIVSGWHDREWAGSAARMEETIDCLRGIFAGERSAYDGRHVRTHGFRLRSPLPDARISVAAFGPAMTRVAARRADEVVLNLVSTARVHTVRQAIETEARAVGRTRPRLAVWVPVALEPGDQAHAQLASQLAVYLAAPGYGEMFCELGFEELVQRARGGARRAELARLVPSELLNLVSALGSAEAIGERVAEYHNAGADVVGVAPSTAEDPGGERILTALAKRLRSHASAPGGAARTATAPSEPQIEELAS
jgi:probable F420-dependent oxidoreductase